MSRPDFFAVGHGMPDRVVADAFGHARSFFEQPEAVKQETAVNAGQRGYRRSGTVTVPGSPPDAKEIFDLGVDLPVGDPDVVANKPMHGPNQWPFLTGFRGALETYYDAVVALGQSLLPGFAQALDLPADFFAPFHHKPFITWRVMRYPPTPESPGQFGTALHTDFGTLTLLAQDDKGGLEVRLRSGEWIEAPHVPGSFIVNIGDLMACWTNDRFTSTAHRVTNRSGVDPYSIPLFFNPSFDTVAECLPSCHTAENPARYEPIHYGRYIQAIYGRIFRRDEGEPA